MEKLTKNEMYFILGGCKAEFDLLIANANVNGDSWTDEQWKDWSDKVEAAAR